MALGAVLALLATLCAAPAYAQLRGHGGPVRAIAVTADGKIAISGSFDQSAIPWSLERNAAEQVLRFHEGAVNAVAALPDGRFATGGEDARIALWRTGEQAPLAVLEGHQAPVVALAVSPDGTMLASASWDRTIRVWPLAGGVPRVLEGHQQNVNGVTFTPDGSAVVSASYDATVRIWPLGDSGFPLTTAMPTPLNAVAVAPDGEIVTAGADGKLYFLSSTGDVRGEIAVGETPVIAPAGSHDGTLIAAAGIRGAVAIVERGSRKVARTLVGPGLPVWSLTFMPDDRMLLTGGADRMVRRWDAVTGEPVGGVALGSSEDPLRAFAFLDVKGEEQVAETVDLFNLAEGKPR